MPASHIFQRDGTVRRGARKAQRLGLRAARDTTTLLQRVRHRVRSRQPGLDDATLAHKVETEIFRGVRSPSAGIEVRVVDGVVWLRGEVKRPEMIRRLERAANAIPEVRGVENRLYLPTSGPKR